MGLSGNRSRLAAITRELALHWDETKNYWRDGKSHEFEQKFIQPLIAQVDKSATTIEKLDKLLAEVRNDCE
jgi:hypothetical protein